MAEQSLEDRMRGLIVANQTSNRTPIQQTQPPISGLSPPPGFRNHLQPQPNTQYSHAPHSNAGPSHGPHQARVPMPFPQHHQQHARQHHQQQFAHPPRSPLEAPNQTMQSGPGARHGSRFPPGIPPPLARQNPNHQSHRAAHGHRGGLVASHPSIPSMTDFPPLGANGPAPKPGPIPHNHQVQRGHVHPNHQQVQVGRQHVENSRFYPRHGHQQHNQQSYQQHYPEQAAHLSDLSNEILQEATPPEAETTMKKQLLERLGNISKELDPTARLIPFGSLVTGFATAASDVDCVYSGTAPHPTPPASQEDESTEEPLSVPELLQKKLEAEGFSTTLLTRTRIPIIKLVQKPTELHPVEMQCDIGFKNKLAIHNTHLLQSYASCDNRVKPMVLFVKWWTKKRRINSPYRGTLSSYGYVLMILHYLINVVEPPVLPNLQLFPIPFDAPKEDVVTEDDGKEYRIWFNKEYAKLGPSANHSSLGELLRGFFEYYAFRYNWNQLAISIRSPGGILTKEEKDWVSAKSRPGNDPGTGETWEVKDRYLLAIEDPFEITHNVGRTCNGAGVWRIREEFKRAMKLIKYRDGGRQLREQLFVEAPPEKPYVRKEDRAKKDAESGTTEEQAENATEKIAHDAAPLTDQLALEPNLSTSTHEAADAPAQ